MRCNSLFMTKTPVLLILQVMPAVSRQRFLLEGFLIKSSQEALI